MDQIQGGNYQYYQPSYNNYQAPSVGQWGGQSYHSQATTGETYYGANQSPESTYNYPSYTSPKTYSTPCMGSCKPAKLYADTYSYLSENLVKPVMQEVYHDLKSITSANTVANHYLASNIGLTDAQGKVKNVPNQGQNPRQK